ncbi:hypothetical protein GEMRC1_013264 [Eukaryota sp. GEM-RC1]
MLIKDIVEHKSSRPVPIAPQPFSFPRPKKFSSVSKPRVSSSRNDNPLTISSLDKAKLQWTNNLSPCSNLSPPSLPWYNHWREVRFDFTGIPLPSDSDISTSKGLHHHAETEDRPGYTLGELATYASSSFTPQVLMAVTTFSGIFKYFKNNVEQAKINELCCILAESNISKLFCSILFKTSDMTVICKLLELFQNLIDLCVTWPSLKLLVCHSLRFPPSISSDLFTLILEDLNSKHYDVVNLKLMPTVMIIQMSRNLIFDSGSLLQLLIQKLSEFEFSSDSDTFLLSSFSTICSSLLIYDELSCQKFYDEDYFKIFKKLLLKTNHTSELSQLCCAITVNIPEFSESKDFSDLCCSFLANYLLNSHISVSISVALSHGNFIDSCVLLMSEIKWSSHISKLLSNIEENIDSLCNYILILKYLILSVNEDSFHVLYGLISEIIRILPEVNLLDSSSVQGPVEKESIPLFLCFLHF